MATHRWHRSHQWGRSFDRCRDCGKVRGEASGPCAGHKVDLEETDMRHDFDNDSRSCRRCGITQIEWSQGGLQARYCTGNAYVCRVARKLLIWLPVPQDNPPLRPWAATSNDLYTLLCFVTPWTRTVQGLVDSVEENPSVCPILADALEEAGCENSALLEALRTP